MITLNFDEVLERTYNAKKGVDVRYGLGQGFEYCKQFADKAQGYATNAKASEKKATDAVAGIEQTKTDAVQAVQNAQTTATDAVQQAQTTATDAVQQAQSTATTAVTTKQTEAVQAVGAAQAGAVKAVDDERDAALQQVASSTKAAQTAASNAATAANAAGNAATAAGGYASNAKSSATAASGSASAAENSKTAAATSESNAAKHEEAAKKAAEEAGAKAGTDKTLSIENAPADAKAVGDYILDSKGNVIFYSKAAVDKLLARKLDLTGGTMNGELIFLNSYYGSLFWGGDLASPQPGDSLANLVIKSWGGISFTTDCPDQPCTGKTAVGVDCRGGIVSANRFRGPADNGVVASGSNYVRFGDGTQICWGQIDTSRGSAIQFPVAFVSNPAVTFTVGNGSTYSDYATDFWWYNIHPTYFAFGRKDFSTSTITWIAIGRWK